MLISGVSMPYKIGSYFMSFSTAHKVMEALSIPNPYNKDILLEFTINFLFCDKEKTDIFLAAYIQWDNEPGMMLVSSFKVHMLQFVVIIFYNMQSSISHIMCWIPGTCRKARRIRRSPRSG